MNSQLMMHTQHSAALWSLAPGEARRLSIGPGDRDLQVADGRLWLTRVGTAEAPAEDIWLEPGQDLLLASGTEWVIEGWSQASFQLLVPPESCSDWRARHGGAAVSASAWRQRASSWASSWGSPTTA
jgi:hypothetical protein